MVDDYGHRYRYGGQRWRVGQKRVGSIITTAPSPLALCYIRMVGEMRFTQQELMMYHNKKGEALRGLAEKLAEEMGELNDEFVDELVGELESTAYQLKERRREN